MSSEFRGKDAEEDDMDTTDAAVTLKELLATDQDDSVFEKSTSKEPSEEQEQDSQKSGTKIHKLSSSPGSEMEITSETAKLPGKDILSLFSKLRVRSGPCKKHGGKHFTDDCLNDICKAALPGQDSSDCILTVFPLQAKS